MIKLFHSISPHISKFSNSHGFFDCIFPKTGLLRFHHHNRQSTGQPERKCRKNDGNFTVEMQTQTEVNLAQQNMPTGEIFPVPDWAPFPKFRLHFLQQGNAQAHVAWCQVGGFVCVQTSVFVCVIVCGILRGWRKWTEKCYQLLKIKSCVQYCIT